MRRVMLLAGLYAIVLSGGALAASRPHPRYLAFGARHKRAAKLAVTKVSDPPSSFTGALTVKYTVANLGNSHSGPGQTRLYLSPSRTLRAHQKPIAKHKLAGLGAGQRTSRTVKLTATGMSPGSCRGFRTIRRGLRKLQRLLSRISRNIWRARSTKSTARKTGSTRNGMRLTTTA